MKIQQTVATSEADRKYIREFENLVATLVGLVIEAHEITPAMLLSPNVRKVLAEKAKQVGRHLGPIRTRLVADNLNEDLKPWSEYP